LYSSAKIIGRVNDLSFLSILPISDYTVEAVSRNS
jgi:hypothetical protein